MAITKTLKSIKVCDIIQIINKKKTEIINTTNIHYSKK